MPKDVNQMTKEEIEAELQQLNAAEPKHPSAMTKEEVEAELKQINAAEPSFMKDVKEGSLPALERGILGLQTTPTTIADLGLRAANQLVKPRPFTSFIPYRNDIGSYLSGKIQNARDALDPYTYGGALEKAAKYDPNIMHQNETVPGQFLQTGIEYVPGTAAALLTGGESALPTIAKAASSAVGSETAGQLADRYAPDWSDYARMGGALIGLGGPGTTRKIVSPGAAAPGTAAAQRAAQGKVWSEAGVPPPASAQSGSKIMATLEGGPSAKQAEKVTDVVLDKAKIDRSAGNNLEEASQARLDKLDKDVKDLKANTNINVDNQVVDELSKEVNDHLNEHWQPGPKGQMVPKTSLAKPEIQQALDDFNSLSSNNKLSGQNYIDLRKKWNDQAYEQEAPALTRMADRLDAAMERSHPGAWSSWLDNYANAKAVNEVATKDNPYINPASLNVKRPTELKTLAGAGSVMDPKNYPKQYNVDQAITSGAGLAAALMFGVEPGFATWGMAHAIPPAVKAPVHYVGTTRPVQAWWMNQLFKPGSPYFDLPNKRTGALLTGQPAGAFFEAPDQPEQAPLSVTIPRPATQQ